MTDKERLDRIDQAHGELTHTRDLMVYYTRKNISVSYLRSQRKTTRSGCWIYTVRRTKNIGSYGNAFI